MTSTTLSLGYGPPFPIYDVRMTREADGQFMYFRSASGRVHRMRAGGPDVPRHEYREVHDLSLPPYSGPPHRELTTIYPMTTGQELADIEASTDGDFETPRALVAEVRRLRERVAELEDTLDHMADSQ